MATDGFVATIEYCCMQSLPSRTRRLVMRPDIRFPLPIITVI